MAKKKPKQNQPTDPIQKELEAIKKLLLFFLLKTGVKAGELSSVVDMDPSDFSRIMPVRKMNLKTYDILSK